MSVLKKMVSQNTTLTLVLLIDVKFYDSLNSMLE